MLSKRAHTVLAVVGAVIVVLLGVLAFQGYRRGAAATVDAPYQAVLLDNGQAYFGKLQNLGASYPVLEDVYYVQSRVNKKTKEVTNTLVKRGKEWHEPDRMILNADHILFIEPVSPDSTVAKLIEKSKGQ